MCGIAGWFSPAPVLPIHGDALERMVDAIRHRGPDGRGSLLEDHAAFGHARLAVIDLDTGDQPMRLADEPVSITYNGEIYNFRELRSRLESRGHRFRTGSDTEVILRLYLEHGADGFAQLRGMYAFALWDGRSKEGLLVRDPVGIKPLFYREGTDGSLQFGSEAKAILAGGGGKTVLEERSLHLLMNFRYLPGDRTMFQGIRQLTPGTVLRWSPGGISGMSRIPDQKREEDQPLLEALEESVKAHLTADVEVGAYLSGGIDSAMVVALARKYSPIRTFTLDAGDDPNEAANAAASAQILDVANHQASIQRRPEETLPDLIHHLEVPKVNSWQIQELARCTVQHTKVALSGLGGDELFYGYNAHRILHLAHRAHRTLPQFVSKPVGGLLAAVAGATPGPPWTEPERAGLMLSALGNWPRVYGLLRNLWDDPGRRQMVYGPRMLDMELPDAFQTLEELWPDQRDPVAAMADFEWRQKMVNDLLWQEDRCSMAVGLEVRVPFLDQRLHARTSLLGRKILMPDGERKGYIKNMVQPLLGDTILNRPKSGFQVDAGTFFTTELSGLADHWLAPERIRASGLFNPEFVKNIRRQRPRKGLRWHFFMLYLMLGTEIWLDRFRAN